MDVEMTRREESLYQKKATFKQAETPNTGTQMWIVMGILEATQHFIMKFMWEGGSKKQIRVNCIFVL